jgi:hypothetical protein
MGRRGRACHCGGLAGHGRVCKIVIKRRAPPPLFPFARGFRLHGQDDVVGVSVLPEARDAAVLDVVNMRCGRIQFGLKGEALPFPSKTLEHLGNNVLDAMASAAAGKSFVLDPINVGVADFADRFKILCFDRGVERFDQFFRAFTGGHSRES